MKRLIPLALTLLAACGGGGARLAPQPVALESGPPLVAVQVGDAQEAAILVQVLGEQPVTSGGHRLYFDARLAERLRGAGFDPVQADPEQVMRRVVRAYGQSDAGLRAMGVRILLREGEYWVVDGTRQQLRGLQAGGEYRLTGIVDPEPRPRVVRVTVPAPADVQRVYAAGVDVYQAEEDANGRWVVLGGAFEWQIEAMASAGFAVERLPVPAARERA